MSPKYHDHQFNPANLHSDIARRQLLTKPTSVISDEHRPVITSAPAPNATATTTIIVYLLIAGIISVLVSLGIYIFQHVSRATEKFNHESGAKSSEAGTSYRLKSSVQQQSNSTHRTFKYPPNTLETIEETSFKR